MKSLALCLCVMIGLMQGYAKDTSDAGFAQRGVTLLINGDPAAAEMLDWETLQSMGTNVGETYVLTGSEEQKKTFRSAFITNTAATFVNMHANADTFSNWKVREQDAARTVVVADTHHEGKLLVTVIKRGAKQKISSVSIGL